MSRPILSRPRTRVYGCNYDKGESYYKPMVDHLDRKYSARPLFAEPRNSLADEIAARRSDIGSRSLAGTRNDSFEDLDYFFDGRGRIAEEGSEDDFVLAQRRLKERAAAAFEEDLADLRRKRRDMQDRIFDVIDLNAEIEKARTTLEAADTAFQRHASKFDNTEDDTEDMSMVQKIERTRKLASIDLTPVERPSQPKFKWTKLQSLQDVEIPSSVPKPNKPRQNRGNSLVDNNDLTENPLEILAMQPIRRRFMKRKKSVSF